MVSSSPSSSQSSVTPSPTPSTPSARPSPRSTSSTPSSARAAPSTVSVAKRVVRLEPHAWSRSSLISGYGGVFLSAICSLGAFGLMARECAMGVVHCV